MKCELAAPEILLLVGGGRPFHPLEGLFQKMLNISDISAYLQTSKHPKTNSIVSPTNSHIDVLKKMSLSICLPTNRIQQVVSKTPGNCLSYCSSFGGMKIF